MCLTQEFNKELEVKSALKASVISSGSLILLLSEREHIIKTQKISRSSSAPRTSTPSENTTIPENLEPSETSILTSNNPEDSSSVDVIFPSFSIQNISSEESLSTTERSDANITNEGVISEEPVSSALDLSVKQEMVLSPVLLALQSQLSQVEQDWVEIQTHIPTVQQKLHQVHFSLYFNLSEIIACNQFGALSLCRRTSGLNFSHEGHAAMIFCISQQLMKSVRNRVSVLSSSIMRLSFLFSSLFCFDYMCPPSPGSTVFFLLNSLHLCLSLSSVSVLSLSLRV